MLVRCLCLTLALLCASAAHAADPVWFPVNMTYGCVPMSDMDAVYPQLKGGKTPAEFAAMLASKGAKTRIVPFVDQYDSEEYRSSHPNGAADESAQEKAMRKLFTASNALMLTWDLQGRRDGLLFYTGPLCQSIYGKLPKD
jgi:hypothetical protein